MLKVGQKLKRKSDKRLHKILEIVELSNYYQKPSNYIGFHGFYVPQKIVFEMFEEVE